MVAFLDIDDVVTMVFQDLEGKHQRRLNTSHVLLNDWQLLLPSVDHGCQGENAGEVVDSCCSFSTQLGLLLYEVIDRGLQSHWFNRLAFVTHLLVVASPGVPQVHDRRCHSSSAALNKRWVFLDSHDASMVK